MARYAQTFVIFAAMTTLALTGCSTGTTLVNGQDPFAAAAGSTATVSTTATQASGQSAPGSTSASTPAAATTGTAPGATGSTASPVTPAAATPAVGIEVDGGGDSLNTPFWTGSLAAVAALSPKAPLAARVVVGNYGSSGVSLAWADDGSSALPTGRSGVTFAGDNGAEALLSALDQQNAKVLVEVQPGTVALPTLAAEVMRHFKGHKSVVGVSVNLAYYGTKSSNLGTQALSDGDATAVVAAVQKVSGQAVVYLRHYSSKYMPQTARTGLGFALDAQGFSGLSDMSQSYGTWATTFAPAPVQFIVGGANDASWSCQLTGGAQALIAAAQKAGSNVSGVLWAAESIGTLYPSNVFSCLSK